MLALGQPDAFGAGDSRSAHFAPRGTFDRLVNAFPQPMQLVADTGDTSADGEDLVNSDEAVEQGGDDLLG